MFGGQFNFGAPQQPQAFGGQSQQQQQTAPQSTGFGLFGNPQQPTAFGGQPNAFGQPTAAPSGMFGNTQQSTVFGGQPNAFGQTAAAAPATGFNFGAAQGFGTAQPAATFGAAPQPAYGASQPQAQAVFGSTQPSNFNFGGQPAAAPTFGSQAQQPTFGLPTLNAFGAQPAPAPGFNAFGGGGGGTLFGAGFAPSVAQQPPAPGFQQPNSPFGQPIQPTLTFGQGNGTTFGGNAGAQDDSDTMMMDSGSGPTAAPPTFGTFGQTAPAASTTFAAFSRPSTGGAVGPPASPRGTPFGQPPASPRGTPFGSTAVSQPAANTAPSPFGQVSSPRAMGTPSVFGSTNNTGFAGFGSTNNTGFGATTLFGAKPTSTATSGRASPLAFNAAATAGAPKVGFDASAGAPQSAGKPPLHPPVNQRSRSRIVGMDDDTQRDAMQALSSMAPSFLGTSNNNGRDDKSSSAAAAGAGGGTAAGNDDDPDMSDDEEDVKLRGFRMSAKFNKPVAGAAAADSTSVPLATTLRDNEEAINLEDAVILEGKCFRMCSEAEIDDRVKRNQIKLPERIHDMHIKQDGTAWTLSEMCMKTFVRAAAGTIKNDETQVRPPEWLRISMKYLEDHVMDLRYVPDSNTNDPRIQEHIEKNPQWPTDLAVQEVNRSIFDYVWDRTREIRGDYGMQGFQLTVGRLDSVEDIHVFERIIRWHLVMFHRVYDRDPKKQHGNWVQNREQLAAAFASLQELYRVARNKVKRGESADLYLSPHEPEFCSYYLLLNLGSKEAVSDALRQWSTERPDLWESAWFKLAMKAYVAYDTGYYHTFFQILRTGPYLIRVCLSSYVRQLRVTATKIMNRLCRDVTLEEYTSMLCFEADEEMRDFLFAFKKGDFDMDAALDYRPFDVTRKDPLQGKRPALTIPFPFRMDSTIGAGMEQCSVASIVRGEAGIPDEFKVLAQTEAQLRQKAIDQMKKIRTISGFSSVVSAPPTVGPGGSSAAGSDGGGSSSGRVGLTQAEQQARRQKKEQDKAEVERFIAEKLAKAAAEKEAQRVEQERIEKEKQDKIEADRAEREKAEAERIERERRAAALLAAQQRALEEENRRKAEEERAKAELAERLRREAAERERVRIEEQQRKMAADALALQRQQEERAKQLREEWEREEAAARKKLEEERLAQLKQEKQARKQFNYHLAKRFLGICGLRRWEARFAQRREEYYQRCRDTIASADITINTTAKRRASFGLDPHPPPQRPRQRPPSPPPRPPSPTASAVDVLEHMGPIFAKRYEDAIRDPAMVKAMQTLIGLAEFHLWEPNIVFKITLASTVLGQPHGILACVRTILAMHEGTYITNHTGKVKSLNGRERKACITICETSALTPAPRVMHGAGLLVFCVQHNINSWEQQATALANILEEDNGLTGLACIVIVMPLTLKVGEPFCEKPIVEETITCGEMVIELLKLQQYINKGYNVEVLGIAAGENVNDKLCDYLVRAANIAPLPDLLASIRPSDLIRRAAQTTTQKTQQVENMKDMCNAFFGQSQLSVHWPPHESADENGVVRDAAATISMYGADHVSVLWNKPETMANLHDIFVREVTENSALSVDQMLRQADRNMLNAVGSYGVIVAMTPEFVAAMKDLETKEERRKWEIEKELERDPTGGRGNQSFLEYVRNPVPNPLERRRALLEGPHKLPQQQPVYTPPTEPKVDAAQLLLKEIKDLAAKRKEKRGILKADREAVQHQLDSLVPSKH